MNVIDPMDRKEEERYWFRCLKNGNHRYWITFDEFFADFKCHFCKTKPSLTYFDCFSSRKKASTEEIDHEVPTATLRALL